MPGVDCELRTSGEFPDVHHAVINGAGNAPLVGRKRHGAKRSIGNGVGKLSSPVGIRQTGATPSLVLETIASPSRLR